MPVRPPEMPDCDRVSASKHAPRESFHVLECCHGLAEIVEGGAVVLQSARL